MIDDGKPHVIVLNPDRPPTLRKPDVSYSVEVAEEICKAIAGTTTSLLKLCDLNQHWPSYPVVYEWRVKHRDFDDAYVVAQKMRAALLMDQIIDIVDEVKGDIIKSGGKKFPNPVNVQRARIRAEYRERVARRLDPQAWGDKVDGNGNAGYLPQDEAIKLLK